MKGETQQKRALMSRQREVRYTDRLGRDVTVAHSNRLKDCLRCPGRSRQGRTKHAIRSFRVARGLTSRRCERESCSTLAAYLPTELAHVFPLSVCWVCVQPVHHPNRRAKLVRGRGHLGAAHAFAAKRPLPPRGSLSLSLSSLGGLASARALQGVVEAPSPPRRGGRRRARAPDGKERMLGRD